MLPPVKYPRAYRTKSSPCRRSVRSNKLLIASRIVTCNRVCSGGMYECHKQASSKESLRNKGSGHCAKAFSIDLNWSDCRHLPFIFSHDVKISCTSLSGRFGTSRNVLGSLKNAYRRNILVLATTKILNKL